MPALKNPAYEIVAQARARGASQIAAVLEAGLSRDSANRVCRRPEVIARVEEINPAADLPSLKRRAENHRRSPTKIVILKKLLDLSDASRENKNYREANLALKHAAALLDSPDDGSIPKTRKTKPQKLREATKAQRAAQDMSEEQPNDADSNVGATPDISEIAEVLGGLGDGPGDGAEAEEA